MTKRSIGVIGAGITGILSAYELRNRGYDVTIYDRRRYPAMDTSFANGGQLSASNAEVWNHLSTVRKGLVWMFKKDAPLSLSLFPSWHKYSWLAESLSHIPGYKGVRTRAVRNRTRPLSTKDSNCLVIYGIACDSSVSAEGDQYV